MKYLKTITLTLLVSLAAMRCGIQRVAHKRAARLRGGKWALIESGKPVNANGKPIYLHFLKDKFQGYTGCNTMMGTYTRQGEALSLHKLKSTGEQCEDTGLQEAFLSLLSEVNRIQIQAGMMELYKDKILLLKFRKQRIH